MRRATIALYPSGRWLGISIHALHEESDNQLTEIFKKFQISIHALHEESDLRQFQHKSLHVIAMDELDDESDCVTL